jgi:hypothetical protein
MLESEIQSALKVTTFLQIIFPAETHNFGSAVEVVM